MVTVTYKINWKLLALSQEVGCLKVASSEEQIKKAMGGKSKWNKKK